MIILVTLLVTMGQVTTSVEGATVTDSVTDYFITADWGTAVCNPGSNPDCENGYTSYQIFSAEALRIEVEYRAIYDGSTTNAKVEFLQLTVIAGQTKLPGTYYPLIDIQLEYPKAGGGWSDTEYILYDEQITMARVDDNEDWVNQDGWAYTVFDLTGTITDYEVLNGNPIIFKVFYDDLWAPQLLPSIQMTSASLMFYGSTIYDYDNIVYFDQPNDELYGKKNGGYYDFGQSTHYFTVPPYVNPPPPPCNPRFCMI